MSTTDRAFIRAYTQTRAERGHGATPVAAPDALAGPVAQEVSQVAQAGGHAVSGKGGGATTIDRHYIPRPHALLADAPPVPHAGGSAGPSADRDSSPTAHFPLSEFAAPPAEHPGADFCPAFEVERFSRPEICRMLSRRCGPALGALQQRASELISAGANVLAVVSLEARSGCTTLAVTLADYLMTQERRVVLVDADLKSAELATALGVAPVHDWPEVLCGEVDLEEALIQASSEPLAAVLVREPHPVPRGPLLGSLRASTSVEILRQHYDVVLVDYGKLEHRREEPDALLAQLGIHAAIGVAKDRGEDRSAEQILEQGMTIPLAAVIHNFALGDSLPQQPHE